MREWELLRERIARLFKEAGISPKRSNNAMNILKGRSRRPQQDTLREIAGVLGVPVGAVTGDTPHIPGIAQIPWISAVDIADGAPLSGGETLARLMLPMSVLEGLSVADLRAFEALSDSMEPEIRAGDIVLVDLSSQDVAGGGVFLVHDGNGFSVCRVMPLFGSGRIQLLSDNPRYPRQEVELGAARIVGRAVRAIRTL